jgi:hypothetical protein
MPNSIISEDLISHQRSLIKKNLIGENLRAFSSQTGN